MVTHVHDTAPNFSRDIWQEETLERLHFEPRKTRPASKDISLIGQALEFGPMPPPNPTAPIFGFRYASRQSTNTNITHNQNYMLIAAGLPHQNLEKVELHEDQKSDARSHSNKKNRWIKDENAWMAASEMMLELASKSPYNKRAKKALWCVRAGFTVTHAIMAV